MPSPWLAVGGMGRAITRRLAQEGAKVVVADLDAAAAAEHAREIGGSSSQLDVTDPASWQACIDHAGNSVAQSRFWSMLPASFASDRSGIRPLKSGANPSRSIWTEHTSGAAPLFHHCGGQAVGQL